MSLNFSNPLYVSWQHRVTKQTSPVAAAAYEMNCSIGRGESVFNNLVVYYKIMEEEEEMNHLIQELLEKHPT